jgi:D-proline reductase (dithiol) PrdB
MPRIEDLSDAQRQAVLNFACFEYDGAQFVPLREPLEKVRLALVTTAGLHCRGDRTFTPGDQSYRVIPFGIAR